VIPVKKRERIKNLDGTVIGELVTMEYNEPNNDRGYLIAANGIYLYRIYSESSAKDAEEFFNSLILDDSAIPR
jgi:hypothetical protein